MPTPAARAAGRLVMRAITAPAMARSRRLGPNDSPAVKPFDGSTRMAVNADTIPARAHASDDMRPAKMPAMRAASGLADAARMPRPKRLRRRNTARAMTTMGPNTSMPMYACVSRRAPRLNSGSPGGLGYLNPADAVGLKAKEK